MLHQYLHNLILLRDLLFLRNLLLLLFLLFSQGHKNSLHLQLSQLLHISLLHLSSLHLIPLPSLSCSLNHLSLLLLRNLLLLFHSLSHQHSPDPKGSQDQTSSPNQVLSHIHLCSLTHWHSLKSIIRINQRPISSCFTESSVFNIDVNLIQPKSVKYKAKQLWWIAFVVGVALIAVIIFLIISKKRREKKEVEISAQEINDHILNYAQNENGHSDDDFFSVDNPLLDTNNGTIDPFSKDFDEQDL